jgi:hypothetical protein
LGCDALENLPRALRKSLGLEIVGEWPEVRDLEILPKLNQRL